MTKIKTVNTNLQKIAVQWAETEGQIKYLIELLNSGLNKEQEDFVSGYLDCIQDDLIHWEGYLVDSDKGGKQYSMIREMAAMLQIKPSKEFLDHLESKLSKMKRDGRDFQIEKVVKQFNSFYYSCAIYVTSSGQVLFNGCYMESKGDMTVLFTKRERKQVGVKMVKEKLQLLGL